MNKAFKGQFPMLMIDFEDRDNRPPERSFEKFLDETIPLVETIRAKMEKKFERSFNDTEIFQYVAWSYDLCVSRLMWALDYDPEALRIIAAASYDSMERYSAYEKGVFSPPKGERFETPQAMEESLAKATRRAQSLSDFDPPTSPVSTGGYL